MGSTDAADKSQYFQKRRPAGTSGHGGGTIATLLQIILCFSLVDMKAGKCRRLWCDRYG